MVGSFLFRRLFIGQHAIVSLFKKLNRDLCLFSSNAMCTHVKNTVQWPHDVQNYPSSSEDLFDVSEHPCFYSVRLLASRQTPKLEDHSGSAVHECLFNISTANLCIWRPTPPSATQETRHDVVTNPWKCLQILYFLYELGFRPQPWGLIPGSEILKTFRTSLYQFLTNHMSASVVSG